MWDEIFKFINDHYPLLGAAFILVAVTIYLTSRYFHWAHRVEKTEEDCRKIDPQLTNISQSITSWAHRVEKTEEDCRKIDGQIVPQLTTISQSITSLNTSFTSLNTSFKGLVIHLQAKDITFDAKLFMSQSPIALTKLGTEILKAVGGDTYIDNNEAILIKEMDMQGIKTALDAQIIAPIVISKISDNDDFKHIKDYIFTNPVYRTHDEAGAPVTLSLNIKVMAQVMGVYLRDKYLDKHPELNPEDIPTGIING
jgi:hypothetical protein